MVEETIADASGILAASRDPSSLVSPVAGLHAGPFVAALLDVVIDGVLIIDGTGAIRAVNPAACRMFGYHEAELLGGCAARLVPLPADGTPQAAPVAMPPGEPLGRRKDGSTFPVRLSLGSVPLNGEVVRICVLRDMSGTEEAERQARHDPQTGVLTRSAFLEECERRLAVAAAPRETRFALYCVDIDQFSDINEAYGFRAGDAALKTVADRIAEVLPGDAAVCRVAADEFVALARVIDEEYARTLADLLHDRLTALLIAGGSWVRLRVSIGAALFEPSAHRVDDLNAKAKLALRSVQQNGGNSICFYSPEMAAAASRRMLLTRHLAHAIERDELRLVYQPIVAAETGQVVCAETLLRWWHSDLGAISPAEFIPVAEESGLIVPITDWVLEQVVRQLAAWDDEAIRPDRVFVNVSALQFQRGNLAARLGQLLDAHPNLQGSLGLEITEQAAVRDLDATVRTIRDLALMGVQAAIDDFGSGYSSLSYVQQLPVAKLKIDRAFVVDVPENFRNAALVRAAVGMAHGLGLAVVAEGVETVEQQAFLCSVGCDYLQGYLFGRPMPPNDFGELMRGEWMREQTADPARRAASAA